MFTFVTNTVAVFCWLIIVCIMAPMVVFALLISIIAGIHFFDFAETKIKERFAKWTKE